MWLFDANEEIQPVTRPLDPDPGPDTADALGRLVIAYGETLAREIQQCLDASQNRGVSDEVAWEEIQERWHEVDEVFMDRLVPVLRRRALREAP